MPRLLRNLLLTVHVLAAAAWIGGGLYAAFALPRHAANSGVKKAVAVDEALGGPFFGTAVVLTILSGIGLILVSPVYGWLTTFVLIGFGVVIADGALQGLVFGPRMKKMGESEGDLSDSDRKALRLGSGVQFALLVLAVWVMVIKLGA